MLLSKVFSLAYCCTDCPVLSQPVCWNPSICGQADMASPIGKWMRWVCFHRVCQIIQLIFLGRNKEKHVQKHEGFVMVSNNLGAGKLEICLMNFEKTTLRIV